MGVRENKVEKYLNDEVSRLGGLTRKWVSPGRDGVPDRIVAYFGNIYFVEVKTTDGDLAEHQTREHERLREKGALVYTVSGHAEVDTFITMMILRK